MDKIIDCGTCHHGLLKSPKMITCCKWWPWRYHRRSFGKHCWDWKERREGRPYFDYNRTDDGLAELTENAVKEFADGQ
jgi:hypothetical protein